MGVVIQKYGGSSLSTIDKIKKVAKRIIDTKKRGHEVVAVVSAMGKTTNQLIDMANEISETPNQRELDMLLTIGERQTIALLSIAIRELGYPAISLTGSQSGIITNTAHNQAKILEIRPYRIEDAILEGKIVIVAGFQGVSYLKEITTLGRGGSDTTALALTAALNGIYCEIYSDVDGVYSGDPKVIHLPKKIDQISYQQMLEMAENGAKVLAADAIRFARHYKIKLYSKHSFKATEGTFVTDQAVIKDVIAVTSEKNLIFVDVPKDKMESFLIFLMENNIQYKELWSNKVDTFLFNTQNLHNIDTLFEGIKKYSCNFTKEYGRVTLIGNQLYSSPSIFVKAIDILKENNIEYRGFHLDHIKFNFVILVDKIDKLVSVFHKKFIE